MISDAQQSGQVRVGQQRVRDPANGRQRQHVGEGKYLLEKLERQHDVASSEERPQSERRSGRVDDVGELTDERQKLGRRAQHVDGETDQKAEHVIRVDRGRRPRRRSGPLWSIGTAVRAVVVAVPERGDHRVRKRRGQFGELRGEDRRQHSEGDGCEELSEKHGEYFPLQRGPKRVRDNNRVHDGVPVERFEAQKKVRQRRSRSRRDRGR